MQFHELLRRPLRLGLLLLLLLGLTALGTPAAVSAQAGGGPRLDLARALALAEANSPALARADARIGMAEGDLRNAGQWPNPTLEYRRENLGSPLQPDEFVTAYIPIDLTGRRVQLHRATSRGLDRLDAERVAARRDVELEIARAWVQAVVLAGLRQSTQIQLEAVEEIARVEAERAREGAVAEAVALRTRVEANRLLHDVGLAEARAAQALVTLSTLLGVTVDSLGPLPAILDTAAVPTMRFGVPTMDGATGDTVTDMQALLDRARRDRAMLRATELAREEAALRRSVERTGVLADWQLQGGTKKTSGFMTGQIGLAVPLPLFNRNGGARLRTDNAVREADAAARVLRLQVVGEVEAAAAQLRRLLRMRDRLLDTPALGNTIAESARVAYAEGQMSLLELLDAERAAADARRAAQQYAADLHLARLTLARAIGAPLVPGSAR